MSFAVDQDAWILTVDDSGIVIESLNDRRCDAMINARLLVIRHGGWLERSYVIGGNRCVVTVPRTMRASFHRSEPRIR